MERHQKRECGREDEDPLVAMDHVDLKRAITEDDDDDKGDEAVQNQCCNLPARAKSE